MSNIAIRVEHLGKAYQIKHAGSLKRYFTLQEEIIGLIRRPFSRNPEISETFWALKDVSFEVKAGEALGIIGRNGAGKSTLLKILSRITRPTTGYADIYGRVGSLLEVGTGFHPELTGRENIYLNGAVLGMTRNDIRRRFDEIVAFAEVEKFLDTPVKRYSSGMYMRLAFSVAAHLEPEILVVDEVLSVGDAEFQKKCLGKMQGIANTGRTVVFVSHEMNAVQQLCTVAMRLDKGQIKHFSCDVRSVIAEYLSSGSEAVEWVNAGNEYDNPWFKPLRFFVADSAGNRREMPLTNDEDITIWIEGEIQVLDPALTIGIAVFAESGQLLFWSYQTDEAEIRRPVLKTGRCILSGTLPKRLLNEGTYRVEFIGGLHFREWLYEPGVNAPSIQITIQGGLSDSPFWMAKRPGLLAPVLEWTFAQ